MEARKTSRDMLPASRRQQPSGGRARVRVPTPAPVRPPPDPMDQTPGPETLASVLEPTPGPEALPPEALSATLEPPPDALRRHRAPHRPKKGAQLPRSAPRIGICLLGAHRRRWPERMRRRRARVATQPPPAASTQDALGSPVSLRRRRRDRCGRHRDRAADVRPEPAPPGRDEDAVAPIWRATRARCATSSRRRRSPPSSSTRTSSRFTSWRWSTAARASRCA